MAVVLADLLHEENIALELAAATRAEALREIVSRMTAGGAWRDAGQFLAAVVAREEVHTTAIGSGWPFTTGST